MANITTDQWYGPLLGERSPRARGLSDDDVAALMEAGGRTPPPLAAALEQQPEPMPAPEPEAAPARQMPGQTAAAPSAAQAPASRVEQLKSLLQRPTNKDHALAAMFDSLVGGDKYTSDVRARRNMFDQAAMGALAADQSAAEREAEADKTRQMQREQMSLTARGQDLANQRAEEQRILQEKLLGLRQTGQKELQTQRDAAALERAKIGPHHGGAGGPPSPEAEDTRLNMEAAHMVRFFSAPGRPAPFTQKQALAHLKGEQTDLPPEVLDGINLEKSTLDGMLAKDPKRYADMIASAAKSEGASAEGLGKKGEEQLQNKKERLKLKSELGEMKADVTAAIKGWNSMSPTAKNAFVQFAGGGGNLAQTLKDIRLSPEDKAHGAAIQSLANVLIKARSGSAVTGSEWQRVAQEIGLPVGDWSIFNSPTVLASWLQKAKQGYDRRRETVLSEYPDLFKEASGAAP